MLKGLGLLMVITALAIAALLLRPEDAVAQEAYCPAIGIIPGSVSVISTNSAAGQISGHQVRFQICGAFGGQTVKDLDGNIVGPPDKLALLWQGFTLEESSNALVTLSVSNSDRWWPTTAPISRGYYGGLTIEFTPDQLAWLKDASASSPLSLQFNIPVVAGMYNPDYIGEFPWDVVLYRVLHNSCQPHPGDFTSTIVPANSPGETYLSERSGAPGYTNTIVGRGFDPWAKVTKITIGSADAILLHETSTDGMGNFEQEFLVPGQDVGIYQVEVYLDGTTFNAGGFTVTESGWGGPPRVGQSLYNLGDNFVRAFHHSGPARCWSLYDPEIPEESDLRYLITGATYWILVKEPAQVILNYTTRNLTCTPVGNCWNQIVW